MNILIAEDDPTSRYLLTPVLRKAGHEVVETEDGEAALAVLSREDSPRLAILDWMMPGLDGLDVVRRVRSLKRDFQPYLIMLTSKTSTDSIVSALDAGADDYIVKPFNSAELHARVAVGGRLLDAQAALMKQNQKLQQAINEIETLRGIIPICANCKRIRDDQGYWSQVEVYMSEHSKAKFSHGICPDCYQRLYPELADE